MNEIKGIRPMLSQGLTGGGAWQFEKLRYSLASSGGVWVPAINAYRYPGHVVVCVDLAGVDQSHSTLHVEERRVIIRGRRTAPRPLDCEESPSQILAMEIDDGVFEREVILPISISPEEVKARQLNGFLWIYLPIRFPT